MRKRQPWINPRAITAPRSDWRRRIAARKRPLEDTEQPFFWIGPFGIGFGAVLAVIIAFGAVLRFAGINWGGAYYMHPDERFMTIVTTSLSWPDSLKSYFDSATSPLNPYNNDQSSFIYGTFPVFLTKLIGTLFGDTVYGNAHMPGRILAAISDLGTIAMVAWIGRMLMSRMAGLFAATLLAFTALNIQTAHYYSVDSMAVFCITATLAFSISASRRQSWGRFAVAGLVLGLAAASKPNSALAAGFLALPVLEQIRTGGWASIMPSFHWSRRAAKSRSGFSVLFATMLAGFVALWTFRFANPYAFKGPSPWSLVLDPRWTRDIDYWRLVQSGAQDYPPSIQWADRMPIGFVVENMVRFGMAPAFGLTALAALAIAGIRIITARRWPSWWLMGITVWSAFHIVYYGIGFIKAQRYLLPAYPTLAILAGGLLASLVVWADRKGSIPLLRGKRIRWPRSLPRALHPGIVIPTIVVLATMIYGVAFANIYVQPLSRLAASEWMFENIPAGSSISAEYWDDGMPYCVPAPDRDCGQYESITIYPYSEDSESKLNDLVGSLNRIDYVVLSSRRLVDSIDRMPYRWPMTTAYYDYLFNGELGFDLVATFDSPPSIGGLTFDDRAADESLTVYEHPTVYIFKKSPDWDYHTAWSLLDQHLVNDTIVQPAAVTPPRVQLLDAADRDAYYTAGTWSNMFSFSSWTQHQPVLWWYLALQLLSLPAIPLLWRLLPGMPDRGYAIAKTLGLIGVSYIAWLIASLRLMEFGPPAIAIGWGIMVLASLLALHRHYGVFFRSLREKKTWIIATELLFIAILLVAVWIRANNPDLWDPWRGGEKPLDLAFFNATVRTPYFPPYDPWFVDGTIHYYYWGQVPWAVMSRLTGIIPTTAYNLAVPSIFALLLLNVWSAAATLISHLVPRMKTGSRFVRSSMRPLLLALIAPILVGIVGNLQLVRLIGQGVWEGTKPLPGSVPVLGGLSEMIWGLFQIFILFPTLPTGSYWDPTRVIPETINEFPYFSFLFGDLHPHYTTMPIISAFFAVVVAFTFGTRQNESGDAWRPSRLFESLGGWRNSLLFGGFGGFLCGMLMASNSWDYPPALALLCGVALVISGTTTNWRSGWTLLRDVGAFTVVTVLSSQILWQPYIKHYGSLPKTLAPVSERTFLSDFMAIHGLLLFATGSYLVLEILRLMRAARSEGAAGTASSFFGIVIGIGFLAIAFISGSPSILLVMMIAVVAIVTWYRQYDRGHIVLLGMIGLGLVLLLVPDWVRLENDIGRMNTVFKLYLHAWILLGIAASVGLALVFDAFSRRSLDDGFEPSTLEDPQQDATLIPYGPPNPNEPTSNPPLPKWGWAFNATRIAWSVALALLVAGAAAYPALVTTVRFRDRVHELPLTLDGLAYMDGLNVSYGPVGKEFTTFNLAGDHAAVEWLLENVQGLPTILEAHDVEYRWGNRISAMTGLPTVIGWSAQERVHRPGFERLIQNRIDDVNEIYGSLGTFESIRPLLDKYHVQLIYVGDLERALYGDAALSKFDAGVAEGSLSVIYDAEGVTIYAYDATSEVTPEITPLPASLATPKASPLASPTIGTPAAMRAGTPAITSATPTTGTPAVTPAGTPIATSATPRAGGMPVATPAPPVPTPTLAPVGSSGGSDRE